MAFPITLRYYTSIFKENRFCKGIVVTFEKKNTSNICFRVAFNYI